MVKERQQPIVLADVADVADVAVVGVGASTTD